MSRNDGGPAFAHGNPEQGGDPGMSLRDWLAGQALVGCVEELAAVQGLGSKTFAKNCAIHAYRIADAMLAARATPEDTSQ